jgi:CheY-like chemotaxis protein
MDSFFAPAVGDTGEPVPDERLVWKVLVIDDDDSIHAITTLALARFEVDGRPLQILSARSGQEGLEMLAKHPDTALALVDVVMETDTAGLDLVRRVRAELQNRTTRLAVRTGQAGVNAQFNVISDYDINGYCEKSALTSVALKTVVITGIRGYRDVMLVAAQRDVFRSAVVNTVDTIEDSRRELEQANLEKLLSLHGDLAPLVP